MSVTDTWQPKRPGPASDRDSVTRQTLRAGIRAPPPEKPYINVIGGTGTLGAPSQTSTIPYLLRSTIPCQAIQGRQLKRTAVHVHCWHLLLLIV